MARFLRTGFAVVLFTVMFAGLGHARVVGTVGSYGVPEIDAAAGPAALTLFAGATLLVRGRRRS
jgi:hypothetical protein